MTQYNQRSLFARTIASGGGTFEMHADNFERRDITSGYAVGMVVGTYAIARIDAADCQRIFNYGIARAINEYNDADAIGTWINSDDATIHIDPVCIFDNENDARAFAIEKKQIAFFHLDTMTEIRV